MIDELWKDIPEYENLYQGSNFGRVRSLDRWRDSGTGGYIQKGRILKPAKNHKGYLHVHLCKDGLVKNFNVHRLVYEAFNGAIPDGYEVNHINEDKTDNRLENLNLMTPKENKNWGTRNKKVSVAMTNGKLSKPVLQYTLDGEFVKEWPSVAEAGRNGFTTQNIIACCLAKKYHKTYKGFIWKYKNE